MRQHSPLCTILNDDCHVILILDHHDVNSKCFNVFQLLKYKFTKQQEGKKLWLERREEEYHYIPIEFSKDSYFIRKYLIQYDKLPNGERNLLKQEIVIPQYDCRMDSSSLKGQNEDNTLKDIEIFKIVELNHDKTFILKCVNRNAKVLNHIEHFYSDREFILKCIECVETIPRDNQSYISKELIQSFTKDRLIILEILKKGFTLPTLSCLSIELLKDREIVLLTIERHPNLIEDLHSCLTSSDMLNIVNDREIMMKASIYNYESFKYASDELKNDRNFVMELVKTDGRTIEFASTEMKQDRQVALEAVKQNGFAFDSICMELKNDKELAMIAIKKNSGRAYLSCSNQLKRDLEIQLETLSQNGNLISCFTNDERSDHSLLLKSIEQNPTSIMHARLNLDKHQDRQLYLKAMRMFKLEQYYDQFIEGFFGFYDVINDEEMAFELVKANPIAIHALNDHLKQLYKIGYEATLLWNGYWPISYDEDYFNERIIHAYNGIFINAENGEADFYRNHNKKMWPPAPSKKFEWL